MLVSSMPLHVLFGLPHMMAVSCGATVHPGMMGYRLLSFFTSTCALLHGLP
jgi:hypothetical protein